MSDASDSPACPLGDRKCVPCRGGVPPLKGEALQALHRQLEGWDVVDEHHLAKAFKFPNFVKALEFVNRIGELAEQQGHHPDILLSWGKVRVELHTHKIDGLHESDFILAAKIDKLPA
ncbi:MAG TPA: 4a-hydroxytetrahydrobiopterin dehydratase [Phycisphaerae bacterium]|nr:4a-hydroxytetrahydrobiopterin dehydratase [Phycisphaerae bacterium]